MSALLKTLVAGTLQVGTNSAQGILSVYWNNSQLSPYGLLLFIITFLFGVCLLAVAALALAFRDASFFLLADSAAERSCFRRLPSGRLTLAQIMFGVAGVNALAAVTGWYATPASHTPPLIQAILQSVPIVTAIPLSVYVMKDKKNYLEWKPLLGMSLIIASIVVGIVPSLLDGTGTTGFSGYSTLGWCLVCVFSQIPTGAAMICQQAFLIRAGAHGANVTNLRRMKLIFRMILYQQVFVLVYVAAFFWVDLLPWFGFSDSLQSFQVGTSYSFECSFFGPGGVKSLPDGIHGPDACTPQTPIYAFSYILLYLVMLVCIAVLNVDSAVFNTVCFVLNTAAQAVFWLIPGTLLLSAGNAPKCAQASHESGVCAAINFVRARVCRNQSQSNFQSPDMGRRGCTPVRNHRHFHFQGVGDANPCQ